MPKVRIRPHPAEASSSSDGGGIHFEVDAAAAGDAPGFVERKRAGEIDSAADVFKTDRAADAADARVAADETDCDFAGNVVGRELAPDFAYLQAARQIRGAHPAADDAGFDVSGVFNFEMSANDARDERRVHAEQVGASGYFFYCHFAVDSAAIESAGDMAERDRARGFDRERAANLDAVNRAGFLDRDVAADGIAHRDRADAACVQIAAHASDDETAWRDRRGRGCRRGLRLRP